MMNCTTAREQLALRLYDELGERDGTALRVHLDDCAECRAFSDELGHGLGRLAGDTSDCLPLGWAAQLQARVDTEPSPRTTPVPLYPRRAAGLGLAAGFLLSLGLFTLVQAPLFNPEEGLVIEACIENHCEEGNHHWLLTPEGGVTGAAVVRKREFKRTAPAPLALAGGDLSRLQTYLSR